MLRKTIAKKSSFVISALIFCLISTGCFSASSQDEKNLNKTEKKVSTGYEKPKVVGQIKTNEITESSGIAASKCQPDVLWTHNDSDAEAALYAINSEGKLLGAFNVKGAKNTDWEDIAAVKDGNGECFLYIGDIGNNLRHRGELKVYRVKEPEVSDKLSKQIIESVEVIRFAYPDFRHDAETLMVHPQKGDIYILTKRLSGASGVYKLSRNYDLKKVNTLEKIADLTVPAVPNGFLTGGDISPDGRRVVLCDYFSAYEIVLPERAKNFDAIWKEKPTIIELGERAQGEAVGYSADGNSIFATSEKANSPLIQVSRIK
ncbi:MAG TPA: hypothetical protein VK892_20490 [Pyrinomonadaceae bacterium]|nr:hypothetical protein [Pyrinomonadaceae bacterium]